MATSIFSKSGGSSLSLAILRTNVVESGKYRFTVFGVYLGNDDLVSFTVRFRTPLFAGGTGYAHIINPDGTQEVVDDPYSIFYLERVEADRLATGLYN